MPIEFISTRPDLARKPIVSALLGRIRSEARQANVDDGVLYYGWPKYTDYDAVQHSVDIALLSRQVGVVFVAVLGAAAPGQLERLTDSLSQSAATAASQFLKSPLLRGKGRSLKLPVMPLIFAPGFEGRPQLEVEVATSENQVLRWLSENATLALEDDEFEEARSILEGAKALARQTKRSITDPVKQTLAVALSRLEDEIASFDQRQRQVALNTIGCPQRIRGLAGSGKTVILAMKAALAHIANPDANVLVTFYTRSLRGHLSRLITRFHRHFGDGEPNWKKVHVRHGWGGQSVPGVYRDACLRAEIVPLTFSAASNAAGGKDPLEYACRTLLDSGKVSPFYDLVLIDEGQDFRTNFYQLCAAITKGERDEKQIVWAYDELQDIFNVRVRTSEELFGKDTDDKPRISLARALPPGVETNDFVLPKCYRNQRDTLVLAHAIGFGVYGTPVQMLQGRAHWEDVGYEVDTPDMQPGKAVVIRRPDRNSPTRLATTDAVPLIEVKQCDAVPDEVEYCAAQFKMFIDGGLQPEDLMAIAIDDRAAKAYLSSLAEALAKRGIRSNNIIADRYSEPPFVIEGCCTLSTVYRAKGNEAAVVAVMGCDSIPLDTRSGRNRLFTAFSRTKAWLRISGMGADFAALRKEIEKAKEIAPEMRFVMPDPKQIELIQRDLSDRDARLQRARAEVERMRERLGLTDEDLTEIVGNKGKRGRR